MQKNERKIIEKYSAKAKRHLKYDEKGTGKKTLPINEYRTLKNSSGGRKK
jgi:hypothetical protein